MLKIIKRWAVIIQKAIQKFHKINQILILN